jgi:hypothetical protein
MDNVAFRFTRNLNAASADVFTAMQADPVNAHAKASALTSYTAMMEMHKEVNGSPRLPVKPTKGLATLKRLWRLDPNSRMAKQSCRYPITDFGIEKLVSRMQGIQSVHEKSWFESR